MAGETRQNHAGVTGTVLASARIMTEMHRAPGGDRDPGAPADPQLATVSVADLLDRRVPLEWFESVAIVAGLCSTLVDTQTPGVPASPYILLTPDGTIARGGPGLRDEDDALPRVLHELLAVVPPPTALRLFVLHATSSEGDKSPATFGKALEYYERPGRADIIRAVRQKYFETPIPQPGSVAPAPFPLADKPARVEQQPPPASRRHRRWLVAAGVAICASGVVVVIAAGKSSGRSDVLRTVEAIVTHATEAGRGMAGAIADSLLTSRDTGVSAASTDAPQPVVVARRRVRARAQSNRASHAAVDQPGTIVVADQGISAAESDVRPENFVGPDTDDERWRSVSAEVNRPGIEEVAVPAPDSASAFSTELVPPRLLEPIRLPSWIDPGSQDVLNAIELEIGSDGTVERVRMLSPAMRLTDMMILSAAKTWLFEPASIDGRPVPYRLTLSLASNR